MAVEEAARDERPVPLVLIGGPDHQLPRRRSALRRFSRQSQRRHGPSDVAAFFPAFHMEYAHTTEATGALPQLVVS